MAAPVLATAKRLLGGCSDQELADYLGVDRSLVGHWRSGARPMPVEVLVSLAEYTGQPARLLAPLLSRCGVQAVDPVAEPDTDEQTATMALISHLAGVASMAARMAPDGFDAGEWTELEPALEKAEDVIRGLRAAHSMRLKEVS